MSDLGRQSGSNGEASEVNRHYEISPDDIAVHIRRMRESVPPLFSATIGSIYVEDWTRIMSQNFRLLSVSKKSNYSLHVFKRRT